MSAENESWVVLKFGGSSVANADNWPTIASLCAKRQEDGHRVIVVCSALGGVSDALQDLLDNPLSDDGAARLATIAEQHRLIAKAVGIDADSILEASFAELEQLVAGIQLIGEVSVKVRARVMALGELMSTRLIAAYLANSGTDAGWFDARDALRSEDVEDRRQRRAFLAATCDAQPDSTLSARLRNLAAVVVTQGFIARNSEGETVLLGRGGSDTSAAYFASMLTAERLEIWTDVPGMFSADPRIEPSARLLIALHYDEAQELASAGSRVLHPRCLSPLRRAQIPLYVGSTAHPEITGTMVSAHIDEVEPRVKGICIRQGLVLISMDTVGMWQQVGFLARVFAVFDRHHISVDLVSTSETNVTVSIDSAAGEVSDEQLNELADDLRALCRVRVIHNCTALSLVGRKIRTILSRLAPVLEVFEEEKVHLMSQAANDLNLTFVIDEQQSTRLVRKLHASIIRKSGQNSVFGPRWEELFTSSEKTATPRCSWWTQKREQLIELSRDKNAVYVYDLASVVSATDELKAISNIGRLLYAMKANDNAEILKTLVAEGVDFECVSPGEVRHLLDVIPDLDTSRILFTPNFAPRDEYAWALQKGLQVTVDNLYALEAWPDVFRDQSIFVRLDPGQGRGHHEHVRTAGIHSKFGVPLFEIDELIDRTEAINATVIGIHAHTGSGVHDPENWRQVATTLATVADRLPSVRCIDLGGGIGIPEKPGDKAFDLGELDRSLAEVRAAFPQYELWLEPGRYFVARAGVLLTRVTQMKGKGDMRYIGVGAGMNTLIRPALYGAYHEIVNLSRLDEQATESVTVVGPICETGDRLGSDRLMPPSEEGDVVLIANTGAYGYVMKSDYNRRGDVPEVCLGVNGERQ